MSTGSSIYSVRRSSDADQQDVAELDLPDLATRKAFFGARVSSQLGAVIETSELALTLFDTHRPDRVLGFAAFDDKPAPVLAEVVSDGESFRSYLYAKFELPRRSTWVFLSYFAQKQSASNTATTSSSSSGSTSTGGSLIVKQLLHAAYQALPHRERVLLVLPLSIELESDPSGLHKFFERVPARTSPNPTHHHDSSALDVAFKEVVLYQSKASDFVPCVHVRRARVEDHDDLEPILKAHNESVSSQFGDFFLAELIKDQDDHNVCLVAQAPAAGGGRAVGLLAISDEIQVATLQQSFELDAYNNLAKSSNTTTSNSNTITTVHALTAPQIVICGPPAGGKGTQCELLVQEFGVVHLSTGDMLRASIQMHSPLGLQAKGFMDAGELVPDELIIDVVLERIQQLDCVSRGWLLDGFPRTANQAQAMLRLGIHPDVVVVLDVLDEEVVKRISGRRIDPETGKTYHIEFNPPPPQDEALRARLIQRSDDTEATIRNRLTKFHENCDAVVDSFRHVSKVLRVDGMQDKQVIGELVMEDVHLVKNAQKFKYLVGKTHLIPPKLIITGPPAGGKGTQCEVLVELFNVVHLSTGDILRASIQAGAPLGLQAKGFMDAGELVPDELIVDVILERLLESDCVSRGWLLDGFPRTAGQAQAMLSHGIVPDVVLVLDVPDQEVVSRISGRRVDPVTGKTYHVEYNPPPPEIQQRVIQRSDDNETTILNRLEKYHENCDTVLATFSEFSGFSGSSGSEPAQVQIVRCDGLLPKPVVAQTFTAPVFQRMVETEASAALQFPEPAHHHHHDAALDPSSTTTNGSVAAAALWNRVEAAQAQRNCFAITLFSMDDRFDGVAALDLLSHAFATFTTQDYCLLTLPTQAPEPSFLRVFTLVPPRATSTFTHVLYLVHRDALAFFHPTSSEGIAVLDPLELCVERYTSLDNGLSLKPLLLGVHPVTRANIQDEISVASEELDISLDENPKNALFIVKATQTNTIVGLAVLTRAHDVTNLLRHHFHLDSLLLMAQHRAKDHAIVQHFVLNPVFYACARFVLLEIGRLFHKTCLFYQVHTATSGPQSRRASSISPVLHEFVLAAPRRSIEISVDEVVQYPEQDPHRVQQQLDFDKFALFVISKKLLSEPKLQINHRVVVVGFSDTAVVAVQRLLAVPYLRFTNITIISPLGLEVAARLEPNPLATESSGTTPCDPLAFARKSSLSQAELSQFSLKTHVRVVESKVVQIDRNAKAVVLMDGSCLPYDYLVLTTGLQDGTCTSLGRFPVFNDSESQHQYAPPAVPAKMVALGDPRTSTWLAKQLKQEQSECSLEQLQQKRIAVYGSSLFALQVVQGLVDQGVDNSRIIHLSSARDSVFEDPQIKNELDKEYATRGISVVYNTKIASLVVATGGGVLEGVHTVPAVSVHHVDNGHSSSSPHGPGHSHSSGCGHGSPGHPSHTAGAGAAATTLVPCTWLLCCQQNDADYDIFRAINESGLVYDGRLVVNGHMRTTDPWILAAGSLCRFSRRFIHAKLHEQYNARECGELLAASLLRLLDPLSSSASSGSSGSGSACSATSDDSQLHGSSSRKSLSNSSSAPTLGHSGGSPASPSSAAASASTAVVAPPEMHMPVVRTAQVLGGKTYLQISIPSLTNTLSLQLLPTRGPSAGAITERYTCLLFDDFGVLNRLEYLGQEVLEVGNLQCLVGLHESYLNSALASFRNAYVDDWVGFFRQKWASALYHDRFQEFCVRLHGFLKKDDGVRQLVDDVTKFYSETGDIKGTTAMAQVRVGRGGEALVPSTKRIIESQALDFLSANREILAMYLLPRGAASGNSKKK